MSRKTMTLRELRAYVDAEDYRIVWSWPGTMTALTDNTRVALDDETFDVLLPPLRSSGTWCVIGTLKEK